jgi:hypothetical protein
MNPGGSESPLPAQPGILNTSTRRGVILFNAGRKMLCRAAVCLHTLRRHWDGPVALLLDTESVEAWDCLQIGKLCGEYAASPVQVKFQTDEGKHRAYLNKCLLHKHTPFDVSLLIDLDCIVQGDVTPMLDAAEQDEFALCQFHDWEVKGMIRKRAAFWETILPADMMAAAYNYPAAINTGIYAFRRDSQLMHDWWGYAMQGRESWIPDETCCQAMVASYPHRLMSPRFNTSCRYGDIEKAVIIHFHGRKHCRFHDGSVQFQYNSQMWYREFEQIRELPFVKSYILNDRMLRKYLPIWDAVKERA